MNFSDIRSNIETIFNGWTTTPIAWENAPAKVKNKAWIRISIITTSANNRTFGDNGTLKKGFIVVQVFVPLNKGLGSAYTLADTITALTENKTISQMFTYAATIEHIGESPTTSHNPGGSGQFRELTPGFFQINVKVPFEAY